MLKVHFLLLTGLTLPHFCACQKTGSRFPLAGTKIRQG